MTWHITGYLEEDNKEFRYKSEFSKIIRGLSYISVHFFMLWVILIFLFPPVHALNVTPYNIGNSYIDWKWDGNNPITNISLDGNVVASNEFWISNEYIASNLKPNSLHYLQVYTTSSSGFNETSTLPSATDYVQLLTQFIYQYVWLIIALVLLVNASKSKNKLLGLLAGFIALVGLAEGVATQNFIVYMIYIIVFACGWLIMDV